MLFRSGRHVIYPGEVPMGNLFISLLSAMGVSVPSFGMDGRAPITDLV